MENGRLKNVYWSWEKSKYLDLLKGIIIQSGNDAAVAIAEYVGGTEEGFVD